MTLLRRLSYSALICAPAAAFGALVSFRAGDSAVTAAAAAAVAAQFTLVFFLIPGPQKTVEVPPADRSESGEAAEEKLQELEEIGRLFGGSLGLRDMFRLLSVRVSELIPLRGARLEKAEGAEPGAEAVYGEFGQTAAEVARSLREDNEAGRGLSLREISENDLSHTVTVFSVRRRDEVLGLVSFCIEGRIEPGSEDFDLLEAIRSRIEPAIAGAISRERSEAGSFADPVTGLPNERAFRLVCENRIAEARRSRGDAGLAVVSLDLAGFAEVNRLYGHSTGDRVLEHAARALKTELREMDLLARSAGDEFLVVLSGAGPDFAGAVVTRLRATVGKSFFKLPDGRGFPLSLNSGTACFGPDGETAAELVAAARRSRDGQKPGRSNQVIQFPTKHSN